MNLETTIKTDGIHVTDQTGSTVAVIRYDLDSGTYRVTDAPAYADLGFNLDKLQWHQLQAAEYFVLSCEIELLNRGY